MEISNILRLGNQLLVNYYALHHEHEDTYKFTFNQQFSYYICQLVNYRQVTNKKGQCQSWCKLEVSFKALTTA